MHIFLAGFDHATAYFRPLELFQRQTHVLYVTRLLAVNSRLTMSNDDGTWVLGSEFNARDSDLTIKAVIFSFWSTIVYKFIYDEKRNSSDKLPITDPDSDGSIVR